MAGNKNNPFGYTEKTVGRTVQNVTSDMWEPISTGAPVRKDTPVRKNTSAPKTEKPAKSTGKTSSNTKKTAQSKKKTVDVTQDRISQGGKKTQQKKTDTKKKPPASDSKKKTAEKSKKTSSPAKKKAPKREPKGRDTRNISEGRRELSQQIEKQRAKKRNRSTLEYIDERKSGSSHDDLSKKRSAKKRKKSKLSSFGAILAIVVFFGVCIGAYIYSKGAPVVNINVEGETVYEKEEIIRAAGIYPGVNMLSIREKTVNGAVTVNLPYVSSIEVDYQLPDTVLLKVTPTVEKYMIVNGETYICIDETDKVVSLKKKKMTEGKFRIEGFEQQAATEGETFVPTENNAAKYERAKEIISVISSVEGLSSGTLDLTDEKNITFTYESRMKIYLGACEKLESQLRLAMEVIKDGANEKQTGYIDTRFGNKAYMALGSMEIK